MGNSEESFRGCAERTFVQVYLVAFCSSIQMSVKHALADIDVYAGTKQMSCD